MKRERIVFTETNPIPSRSLNPLDQDLSLLHIKPPQKADPTPLDHLCNCPEGLEVKRYQCVHCIKSWVETVCPHLAFSEADRLVNNQHEIAATRIREAVEEKRKRKLFNVDSSTITRCSNCSSK